MAKRLSITTIEAKLRDIALSYPESHEDFPWGERCIKVKGKGFIFMRAAKDEISLSVKLPQSRDMAADLPFTEPTHYGMGKYGWVTAHITPKNAPMDLLKAWIDESYRAVAPKKLVKELDQ
jgi:predicted DNA-binding protein (MmcQ/YjbR family)